MLYTKFENISCSDAKIMQLKYHVAKAKSVLLAKKVKKQRRATAYVRMLMN